jgi:hypothetical protein
MGEKCAHMVLVGKTEGKRSLGRPRRRWDNIKMDLQEVGWGMDWIDPTLVNTAMNLRVP